MNVAQLKPWTRRIGRSVRAAFPRSYERGSIEASSSSPVKKYGLTFPRSYERGSIEAADGATGWATIGSLFPRSYERGSIEAEHGGLGT